MLDLSRGIGSHSVFPPLGRAPVTARVLFSLLSLPTGELGKLIPPFLEAIGLLLLFNVVHLCCFICFKLIGEITTILGDGNTLQGRGHAFINRYGQSSKQNPFKSWLR